MEVGAEAAAALRRSREGQTAGQPCSSEIRILRNMCTPKDAGLSDITDWVFLGLAAVNVPSEAALASLGSPMILTPVNEDVGLLNDMAVNFFPSEVRECFRIDMTLDADAGDLAELYTPEYVNTIDHASVLSHRFCAKVACR